MVLSRRELLGSVAMAGVLEEILRGAAFDAGVLESEVSSCRQQLAEANAMIADLEAQLAACQGSGVLPLVAGLSARDAPAAWWPDIVTFWYPRLRHANAQPTEGGPVSQNVPAGMNLRPDFGRYAADWLKQAGPGPIHISDLAGGGADLPTWEADVPVWWANPAFDEALDDFNAKLAAQLNGTLPAIVMSPLMTGYAEMFIRQAGGSSSQAIANRAAYEAKGYEITSEREAWYAHIAAHFARWTKTRTIISFNPGQNRYGTKWNTSDVAWTLEIMDHVASTYPDRVILYNNSIDMERILNRPPYALIYDQMRYWRGQGIPIGFQTAASPEFSDDPNDLNFTMDWAVDMGAHIIELPVGAGGYQVMTTREKLQQIDAALKANA